MTPKDPVKSVREVLSELHFEAYNEGFHDKLSYKTESIDQAIADISAAMPSLEELMNTMCDKCTNPCDDIKARCWDRAEAIHNALMSKEGK